MYYFAGQLPTLVHPAVGDNGDGLAGKQAFQQGLVFHGAGP